MREETSREQMHGRRNDRNDRRFDCASWSATVRSDGGNVGVQVFDAGGGPANLAFHLIVAC